MHFHKPKLVLVQTIPHVFVDIKPLFINVKFTKYKFLEFFFDGFLEEREAKTFLDKCQNPILYLDQMVDWC